jgi:hypothetical protein
MLDTHELPSSKSTCSLIKPSWSGQDTQLPIRAGELNFDITSSLMIDPDSGSDMFQSLKVGLVQHLLRDFKGRLDAVYGDESPSLFDHWLGVGLLALILPLALWVLDFWSRGHLIGGQEDSRRVKPRLRLDEGPRFGELDIPACIDSAVAV